MRSISPERQSLLTQIALGTEATGGATAPMIAATVSRTSPGDAAPAAFINALPADCTVICFAHLRWDFVYQRPQHLMSRIARHNPVIYFEEPIPTDQAPWLELRAAGPNLQVAVPHLPGHECRPGDYAGERKQRAMLAKLLAEHASREVVFWYYTPMSLGFSDTAAASLVVFDCMDELSAFDHAPAELLLRERALMGKADLVFTGGHSLYEAKKRLHSNAHAFPSSVDVAHFAKARTTQGDPHDMADIPHPRVGYYGVIDERMDIALLDAVAAARPDWHWVMVGPVVKIPQESLPRRANIHYLGGKGYPELPAYLGSWDVAMMPFALNASTRFISPTKTPEYLAGGKPVVSTAITDVIRGYGASGLVRIVDSCDSMIAAIDEALDKDAGQASFHDAADVLLAGMSWDRTCSEMTALMAAHLRAAPASSEATLPLA
ncbi:MAG: putative glycosyltransferase, partial [Rhizobacter sp.]|nr:putative glycosyltransferase [Rhizobacter sp.]